MNLTTAPIICDTQTTHISTAEKKGVLKVGANSYRIFVASPESFCSWENGEMIY